MKRPSKKTLEKYRKIIDQWFVNEFNGTAAYKKLYPRVKDSTASVNFSKISKIPEIEEYVKQKNQKALAVVKSDHKGILEELVRWVSSDITETLLLSEEKIKVLPVEYRRLITSYKVNKRESYDKDGNLLGVEKTIECKFVSKERALDMINKHIGFYEVDNKQKAAVINITATNQKHADIMKKVMDGKLG